jgi:hypothetical protein
VSPSQIVPPTHHTPCQARGGTCESLPPQLRLTHVFRQVQFTFTLSNFYTRLHRKHRLETLDSAPRRILLLPASTSADIPLLSSSTDPLEPAKSSAAEQQHVIVYAPVRHTLEAAHELGATEAWVSSHRRGHSHSHSHSRSHGGGTSSRTGLIQLEIQDGEGLLPDPPIPSTSSPSTPDEFQKRTDSLEERRTKSMLKRV